MSNLEIPDIPSHPDAPDHVVTIEVETTEKIRPGRWRVSNLKKALKIASSQVLAVFEATGLKDLKDDEEIGICGGEQFICHARSGGSS